MSATPNTASLQLPASTSTGLFGDSSLTSLNRIAERYSRASVSRTVSLRETGADHYQTPIGSARYYRDGERALEIMLAAMLSAGMSDAAAILDMPCGYGRVARHIRAAFPSAALTVCDIEPDMLDFCRREFGAAAVPSKLNFADLHYSARFDLIWCGSLLTHLPQTQFIDALNLFARSLLPGGIAVVTTHGRRSGQEVRGIYISNEKMAIADRGYESTGFGYVDYTDEPTPQTGNYGITLSSIPFTCGHLLRDPTLRIVSVSEACWGHQDVVVFQKIPAIR